MTKKQKNLAVSTPTGKSRSKNGAVFRLKSIFSMKNALQTPFPGVSIKKCHGFLIEETSRTSPCHIPSKEGLIYISNKPLPEGKHFPKISAFRWQGFIVYLKDRIYFAEAARAFWRAVSSRWKARAFFRWSL